MRIGQKYRVVYQTANVRFPRVLVGVYLGEGYDGRYQFNCRPVAGTQALDPGIVTHTEEVSQRAEPYAARRADR